MRTLSIGARALDDPVPYLIAEAGVNHDGEPQKAHQLIELAAAAGADAVKFQIFEADSLARFDAPSAAYQGSVNQSQYEMLRALELDRGVFVELAEHAHDVGIEFLCTPFSLDAASFLIENLKLNAVKISSGDLTYSQLLRLVSTAAVPILLSTGMATRDEIKRALEDLVGADVILFHCLSQYPAAENEANLGAIDQLRQLTGDPVGFSDHFLNPSLSIAAAVLGAKVIERHFTLDRSAPGPDHAASMDPEELIEWVRNLHDVHQWLGSGEKSPQPSEMDTRVVARRSLAAARGLAAGHLLSDEDLTALRPADGISPQDIDSVVGKRLTTSLRRGASIRWADLE